MDVEQFKELKEQMTSVTTDLVKTLVQDIKTELKAEQRSSFADLEAGLTETLAKISKRVDEMERTLSGTMFVNRVIEETLPPVSSISFTTPVTSVTTSVLPSVTSPVAGAPIMSSTFRSAPIPDNGHSHYAGARALQPLLSCARPPVVSFMEPTSTRSAALNTRPQSLFETAPVADLLIQPPCLSPQRPDMGSHNHLSPNPSPRAGAGNLVCSLVPLDGTVSWPDYRIQFEIVARNSQWTDQEKADALATQLRGTALSVLSVFPRGHAIKYQELVGLLEQRFGMDSYACQVQFCGRVQGPKETFANFALELQRLATAAFPSCPTDVVDRMAALRFLEGLRDDEIRTMVKVRGPKTLQEAVHAAQELSMGISPARSTRVFLTSPLPSNTAKRRHRRGPGNRLTPQAQEVQGTSVLGTAPILNRPPLVQSFVPASHSDSVPSTSGLGNATTSTRGGSSR